MISTRIAIGLAVAFAVQADAQSTATSAKVPRGGPITIDGRVQDDEWRNALRTEQPAGTVVRLLRDADNIYLGITSERAGFASVCVALKNEVRVLHASAALASVTYRPRGDVWNSPDTAFAAAMRNTALDNAARSERAAYLARHGWVASTLQMGTGGRSQEVQIALSRFPLPFSMAVGRWLISTDNSEWWPATITDHEGCFNQQLVRGYVPQGILFKPAFWFTIANE